MIGKKLCLVFAPLILTMTACSHGEQSEGATYEEAKVPLDTILKRTPGEPNPFDSHLDTAPDDNCTRLRVAHIGPLRTAFNDSNYLHLQAAQTLGIDPVADDADIWQLRRPLVEIVSCAEYFVEPPTHSYPYLVPEAARLLKDIGRAFNDSLQSRGGGDYRIKVTSMLRTPLTVRRLRRVNGNAVEESTHSYGTTFDISYSKFICDNADAPHRTFEDLKNLLGEILYYFRARGRCYVKYEFRQSCFHITTRPLQSATTQPL